MMDIAEAVAGAAEIVGPVLEEQGHRIEVDVAQGTGALGSSTMSAVRGGTCVCSPH